VCDVCLQNNSGYTGKYIFCGGNDCIQIILAVMMAAVIDITNDDQRQIVRRLFRESGNVNVKTIDVDLQFLIFGKNFFYYLDQSNSINARC
jgi:hypothetical protein